jgi:hypothetical protein
MRTASFSAGSSFSNFLLQIKKIAKILILPALSGRYGWWLLFIIAKLVHILFVFNMVSQWKVWQSVASSSFSKGFR